MKREQRNGFLFSFDSSRDFHSFADTCVTISSIAKYWCAIVESDGLFVFLFSPTSQYMREFGLQCVHQLNIVPLQQFQYIERMTIIKHRHSLACFPNSLNFLTHIKASSLCHSFEVKHRIRCVYTQYIDIAWAWPTVYAKHIAYIVNVWMCMIVCCNPFSFAITIPFFSFSLFFFSLYLCWPHIRVLFRPLTKSFYVNFNSNIITRHFHVFFFFFSSHFPPLVFAMLARLCHALLSMLQRFLIRWAKNISFHRSFICQPTH